MTAVTWQRKAEEHHPGVYVLRSNRLDLNETQFFDVFSLLTDIEDAFRSMKSALGLRPVYHQKEHRSDGHLFITVLAYHILQTIRFTLRRQHIADSWSTIRTALSSHVRLTTTMRRDDGRVIHLPEVEQSRGRPQKDLRRPSPPAPPGEDRKDRPLKDVVPKWDLAVL